MRRAVRPGSVRRALVVGFASALIAAVTALPAAAAGTDGPGPGTPPSFGQGATGSEYCSASGTCHATVQLPGSGGGLDVTRSSQGDTSSVAVTVPCFFTPAPAPDPDPHKADEGSGPDQGGWYYAGCGTDALADFHYDQSLEKDTADPLLGGVIAVIGKILADTQYLGFYLNGHPPTETVDPVALAKIARSAFTFPTPTVHVNPLPAKGSVVGLYTWAWATVPQQTLNASATEAGVTARLQASVSGVTFDFGAAGQVTCGGLGTPYDPATSHPDGPSPSGCDIRFLHPSAGQPGGTYPVTATVHWAIAGNYLPGGGETEDTVSPTLQLKVGEVESLVTAGR